MIRYNVNNLDAASIQREGEGVVLKKNLGQVDSRV